MSFITDIIGGSAGTFVKDVGDTVKQFVTTDKDRLELDTKLQEMQNNFIIQLGQQANDYEGQITERWKSDNEHIITRLVRPVIVAWLVITFSVMAFLDGNIGGFKINPVYIPVFETLLVTAIIALFGGRSTEKIAKAIKK